MDVYIAELSSIILILVVLVGCVLSDRKEKRMEKPPRTKCEVKLLAKLSRFPLCPVAHPVPQSSPDLISDHDTETWDYPGGRFEGCRSDCRKCKELKSKRGGK